MGQPPKQESGGKRAHKTVKTQDTDVSELPTNIFSQEAKSPPLEGPIRLVFLRKFAGIPNVLQGREVRGLLGGIYEVGLSPVRDSDHVRLEIQDRRREVLDSVRGHQALWETLEPQGDAMSGRDEQQRPCGRLDVQAPR